MSGDQKKVDKGWQKKAGLDLRSAKPQIYKDELSLSRKEKRVIPKVDSDQIHAHVHGTALKRMKKARTASEGERADSQEKQYIPKTNPAQFYANALKQIEKGECLGAEELAFRDWVKKKALKKLHKLQHITCMQGRLLQLRKAEGTLNCVFDLGGDFDEDEADFIVDCAIRYNERPGGHPLQRSILQSSLGPKFAKNRTLSNTMLYSYPSLRLALVRRGVFLNVGHFSSSETLTLMKNFEKFLSHNGHKTDPASIAYLVQNQFCTFYQKNKMFLYVGENLNRSTEQIYQRIKDVYHQEKRDKIPASDRAFILQRGIALKENDVHERCVNRFKVIGSEIRRYRKQVMRCYETLEESLNYGSPELVSAKKGFFKLVDDNRSSLTSLDAIPYDSFAAELGCSREALEKYWVEEGRQKYVRSKFPAWTLEDKDLLMAKVAESGEDEEKCVDFKEIFEENFQEKCADWHHLRERFNDVRRELPFYMLEPLQSVVAAARKDIKQKLAMTAAAGGMNDAEEEEEEEVEEDGEEEED